MVSAFANTLKVPELRQRIFFTLLLIVVVRIGAAITAPGVNSRVLQEWFETEVHSQPGGSIAALFNLFSGGALENCAIFALGIMPFITASIMMQLLTAVIPRLNKLRREDGGQQKIMQYTRYVTVGLCLFQSYLLALSLENPQANPLLPGIMETIAQLGIPLVPDPGMGFRILMMITLTSGTMLLVWLGDQITDRGVGNGISLIITVGIVATLPAALIQAWRTFVPTGAGDASQLNPAVLVLMVAFFLLVTAGVICLTQAQRRISISYAKRVVGRKVYSGQTQYMPLKVNYAGVMPIIFAQAILLFPSTIVSMMFPDSPAMRNFAEMLAVGWLHYLVYGSMIFFFSYFWVATQFQPAQIADDLKRNGGYIPGVRPGKPTADFLDYTMTRLTFAGAIFLTIIAVLPQILNHQLQVPILTAQFFGGTSILIIVGVLLDTMRQIETHLIQRHYDGFLRKGRIRGRFERSRMNQSTVKNDKVILWLAVLFAALVIFGMAVYLAQ